MSTNTTSKPFLHLLEGQGGMFEWSRLKADDNGELLHYIGTQGLITCVAVFFRVDEERFFMAHINALMQRSGVTSRNVTIEEGARVKEAVLERLEADAKANGWKRDALMISKSIIIACPKMRNPYDDNENTGLYVVDALIEFLNLGLSREELINKDCVGFIVGQDVEVQFIPDGGKRPDEYEERVLTDASNSNWTVGFTC
ncbi:hypothetical protein LTR37_008099 [Vermiconidia calcicola]|uniref:Uncharacterized protein n=1 Tax=Vermiconidia calcicola TaxID=1690605 RepID=A0ACC3NBV0_9PEZI|nr:hypothetical protein LTR37_008099 [Vermiconidia calcicola]